MPCQGVEELIPLYVCTRQNGAHSGGPVGGGSAGALLISRQCPVPRIQRGKEGENGQTCQLFFKFRASLWPGEGMKKLFGIGLPSTPPPKKKEIKCFLNTPLSVNFFFIAFTALICDSARKSPLQNSFPTPKECLSLCKNLILK